MNTPPETVAAVPFTSIVIGAETLAVPFTVTGYALVSRPGFGEVTWTSGAVTGSYGPPIVGRCDAATDVEL